LLLKEDAFQDEHERRVGDDAAGVRDADEHDVGQIRETASSMFDFVAMAPSMRDIDMQAFKIRKRPRPSPSVAPRPERG
jgi:hypothetical protein